MRGTVFWVRHPGAASFSLTLAGLTPGYSYAAATRLFFAGVYAFVRVLIADCFGLARKRVAGLKISRSALESVRLRNLVNTVFWVSKIFDTNDSLRREGKAS